MNDHASEARGLRDAKFYFESGAFILRPSLAKVEQAHIFKNSNPKL